MNSYQAACEAFRVTGWMQPGTLGRARIEVREVCGFGALRAHLRGEGLTEGERLTSLHIGGRLVMSDSRDELRDHLGFLRAATGRVLVNGLGLGCALRAVLAKPEVAHVDVVEIEPDVLALVSPYFAEEEAAGRVTFHCADAFTVTWPVGARWDCAWHDVWADKCTDDLEAHARLLRRYGRRVGWQDCWAHSELLYRRQREQKERRREVAWR